MNATIKNQISGRRTLIAVYMDIKIRVLDFSVMMSFIRLLPYALKTKKIQTFSFSWVYDLAKALVLCILT